MTLIIRIAGIILLMFLSTDVAAQGMPIRNAVKGLNVGDVVPDIKMNEIINYTAPSANMSDFKGRLVILDFWATWCGPCVAAFPKLDSLQKKFEGKLQIIPVTSEDRQVVSSFLQRMSKAKNVSAFSVVNDKVLGGLFPHVYLPHYVWIDGNGKVVAITEGKNINEKNINAILSNKDIHFSEKKDRSVKLANPRGTMLNTVRIAEGRDTTFRMLPDEDLIIHSSLTRYIEGLNSAIERKQENYLRMTNMNILWLYRIAFWKNGMEVLNSNSTIIDVSDSVLRRKVDSRTKGMEYIEWLRAHGYCYEIKVPKELTAQKYDIMLQDLNRYFGVLYNIEGVMEEREIKYLALVRSTMEDKLATKGGTFNFSYDKLQVKMQNSPLGNLPAALAVPLQLHPPIIDETRYEGRIDMELNCQLSDLQAVNNELTKYGLQLEVKKKIMKVGVIKMKTKS